MSKRLGAWWACWAPLVVVGLASATGGGPGLGRLAPGLVAMKNTFNLTIQTENKYIYLEEL